MRLPRSVSLRAGACLLAGALACPALASGSSAPFGYTPDPALKTASPAQLEGRVKRSCATTQASLQSVPETRVERPCGCYAFQVIKALDPAEVDAYRNTGVFNDSARQKALAAIDQCKLKRPI